jgi:DNA repair exonuclease SbcCD ATPase subunit
LELNQSSLKTEEETLNKQIIKLNEKIVKLNADSGVSLDELENRHSILVEKKKEVVLSKSSIQERITHREELQLTLEEIIDGYDEEDLENKISELSGVIDKLKELKTTEEKLNIKLDSLYERKKHLDSHKYNENCEVCMENSQTIREQKNSVNSDIESIQTEIKVLNESTTSLNLSSDYFKYFKQEWDTLQEAKEKEDKISREISQLHNQLATKETEEVKLDSQIDQLEKLIEEYIKNEEQIQKNKEIREDISQVRSKLTITKDELNNLGKEILKLNGKISALQNQKETIGLRINEVKELEEQSKLFDYYLNALSKDGVSYELIEKSLPMIEGEVNNILAQIVEFGMQLEMDGKNINAYLVYGDQKWSLEMCSGMERFISGLAIRVALINVCNLPRPNFLVIDEGFGTLDSENLQSLFMLFTYLKTQFDFVMVISHIDSMRDVVDGLIEIKKTPEGFSQVKF